MSPEQLHQSKIRRISVDGIRPKPLFNIAGAKIAVIGLEHDGLSLIADAASRGFDTIGFDADDVKVAQLGNYGTFQDAKLFKNLSITSKESSIKNADVFVICTPTPLAKSGRPDLHEVERAAEAVGRHMHEGSLVIVESIVFPGVCEQFLLPILEKSSGLARPAKNDARGDFFFAHAPVLRDDHDATRIVAASDIESLSRALAFYRAVLAADVRSMHSIREAEAVRMVEDSFRDVNLALADEYAILFDRIGIDIVNVIGNISPDVFETASLARGAGNASTPPVAYYLARSGHEHEFDRQLLSNAHRIIEYMPDYAVRVLSEALREKKIPLKGADVALLGISSERDGSEAYESVGLRIRGALERKGAQVRTYDPYVADAGHDLKETLEGAQAVIIATDHSVFCNLTPRQFEEFGISIVVDARNCLDRDLFEKSPVLYRGIGRG